MARTTTSLKGLFAFLLKPATDALYAETGWRITTDGWGRIARVYAAGLLRGLADLVAPVPVPEVVPAPAPEPVADVAPEPVAVPFGWASLDLPGLMSEQTTDREAFAGEFPTDEPRTYGMTAAQVEALHAKYAPTPEPAPVVVPVAKPKRTRKPAPVAPKTWTVAEVAARLDTQPRAVRKWIEAKRLHATRDGKTWSVADTDLTAFLATLDAPTRAAKGR